MVKMAIFTEGLKKGGWVEAHTITDEATVYARLSEDLIAKKINKCLYIKSIKRVNNYDGTQNITAVYDHGVKVVYTVKA
jgi:hypothetical protein